MNEHQTRPHISHQIQPLKYTRKIYTQIQENMGMGLTGIFIIDKKYIILVCKITCDRG